MPRWHAVCRRWVLARHYRLAREALVPKVAGATRLGLSRNDLDLTVYRAYFRDQVLLLGDLLRLRWALLRKA